MTACDLINFMPLAVIGVLCYQLLDSLLAMSMSEKMATCTSVKDRCLQTLFLQFEARVINPLLLSVTMVRG